MGKSLYIHILGNSVKENCSKTKTTCNVVAAAAICHSLESQVAENKLKWWHIHSSLDTFVIKIQTNMMWMIPGVAGHRIVGLKRDMWGWRDGGRGNSQLQSFPSYFTLAQSRWSQCFSILIQSHLQILNLFVVTMFNCNELQKTLCCSQCSLVFTMFCWKFCSLHSLHISESVLQGGISEKAALLLFPFLLFRAMHPLPSVTNVKFTKVNPSLCESQFHRNIWKGVWGNVSSFPCPSQPCQPSSKTTLLGPNNVGPTCTREDAATSRRSPSF